ncbi:M24 family metallopeptidase [Schlesneria paludicola]|uniref:M24 family metallopeptidase n=1 Tax=Schlesneria paludicola TaxID=360056 RepID=UPI00029B553E|nr:Xaa-Pro peptidase family protein [Schlesneria paludicola]
MSKHDFSLEEFSSRRARVREAISQAGLDWFIAFHPVSIHWLTGSDAKSYQEFQCLLISADEGPVVVLTREGERNEFQDDAHVDQLWTFGGAEPEDPLQVFERVIRSLGLESARVGIEVPAYYLHPHHYLSIKSVLGAALVAEPSNLIHDLKLVKSATEQKYIREAAKINDRAMQVFANSLRAGVSELELAGDVYQTLLKAGSGLAASPINLVSGERAGFSHGPPTQRVLKQGETGSIEYGATFKRYTSTIGRHFCIGKPTSRVAEIYQIVREACDAFVAEVRAGVPAVVPHEAAKRIIAKAGLDRYRVHTSGYGLAPGFPPTWGEPMHLFGGSDYTLRAGMVVTVEPPIFIGEEFLGVRIIDNLLVTDQGAERLSQFSRDIIIVD